MSNRHPAVVRLAALTVTLAAAVVTGGCTKYYQVSDPTGSKTYYTNDFDGGRHENSGAVRFKDAKTGAEVTLQSSEVKEIEKKDFEAAVGKK